MGRTLTDFVVTVTREEVCGTNEEGEIIRLSVEGQRQIAAILNPPEPRPALRRAFGISITGFKSLPAIRARCFFPSPPQKRLCS